MRYVQKRDLQNWVVRLRGLAGEKELVVVRGEEGLLASFPVESIPPPYSTPYSAPYSAPYSTPYSTHYSTPYSTAYMPKH
jgi:hypothetical protein